MAVNFIISPTFEDAKSEILKKIGANNKAGTSHLVIVPDRHSLSYQRAVIEELGLVAVSNIEVVSFSRLADLNITKDKRYLTPQSAVMLMRKVINKNKDKLLRYRLTSRNVGFADEMFAVVSDIRNSAIPADTIKSKLDGISNVAIRNKVSDIAMLYSGYIEELESRYFDATSKFGALMDIIDDIPLVKNSYVYVCDYYEFTNVELKLLEKIINSAHDTYISLVEKEKGANARIFPKLSGRLISMAKKNDHAVSVERHDMQPCPNSLIYDNLFGYVNDTRRAEGKPIKLLAARNIEEEISYVAASIKKSIRDKGLRYRDIAIAVSDIEGYKDTIKAVMARYDIPYYIDDKVPVMSAPSVRHILMALEVVEGKYKRSDVLSFLMNGLNTDITNDEKDIFTNYVMRRNIDRSRFTSPLTIYDETEDIELINSVRERMLYGFDILERNNINQKMSLHIDSIYQYMAKVGYVDRINTFAKAEFDLGYKIESEVTTQAPKKLFKFFDELIMVAGDEEMSQKEFLDIMLASLARVDISLIPKYNDSVYIGDMSASRYDKVKEMYFMGMTQGAVPADMSTRGIMGEEEVGIFSALGMDIEPSPKEKNLLGRFYILELLLKSENANCLTYPIEGVDGKEKLPSIVMKQLADIYDMDIERVDINDNIPEFMATYDNANYRTALNYGKYSYAMLDIDSEEHKIATYLRDKDKFRPFDYNDDTYVEGIHDLYFSKYDASGKYHMSASRIESYLRCPYKAYLQYVLGLKDRDVAEVKVAEMGTILHAMLEALFGSEIAKKDSDKGKLTDKEIERFVYDFVYAKPEYDDKIMHEIYNRCVHVALKTYNMLRKTEYRPIRVECGFYLDDYTHDGIKYSIKGSIDRVDARGEFTYLVDYKSSSNVEFKLDNIYCGDRVQLVMYADMYKKIHGGDIVGLFYMPMPAGYRQVEDVTDTFRFNGLVTSDDISHMGTTIYPLKLKTTKGESEIVADNGEIVTSEELDIIIGYVNRLIDNVLKDIKSGYIGKNPLEGKCQYCDYKNLCGMFGTEVHQRKSKKVTLDAFREGADEREVE